MDVDCDGQVDKAEFIMAVLLSNNVTTPSVLARIAHRFENLDRNGSGVLSEEDLIAGARTDKERQTIRNHYQSMKSVKSARASHTPTLSSVEMIDLPQM